MLKNIRDKKIWIKAMGCRTNQYEADALASALEESGAVITDNPLKADIAILNSCTVTAAADSKTRQTVRRIKRENPSIILAVCGCWAQKVSEEHALELGVDVLVGNRMKYRMAELLSCAIENPDEPLILKKDISGSSEWDELFMSSTVLHTRAFVKVQEGCSHFCSYCIIPHVRGPQVSRPLEDVEREVRVLVSKGTTEIVLTGVHLGTYSDLHGRSLADLVERLAPLEGLSRIRLGSIEPFTLDEKLLSTLSVTPSFCPHLHVPLQSGDDRILSSMRRGYTSGEFLKVLEKVRYYLGNEIHISTDIMAGFPGESRRAFANTIRIMKMAEFGKVHVFGFSPREGTPAFSFPDAVDPAEIHDRVKQAIETGNWLFEKYSNFFLGREMDVLIERTGKKGHGLIRNFIRVIFDTAEPSGGLQKVRLNSFSGEAFRGSIL